MTKKQELKWRLSELPTGGEVADLVSEGVISKDEAREILFKSVEVDKDEEIKALKEQMKFLKDIIKELASGNHKPVVFYPRTPNTYWTNTSELPNVTLTSTSTGSPMLKYTLN